MRKSALSSRKGILLVLFLVLGCSAELDKTVHLAKKAESFYQEAIEGYQRLIAKDKNNAALRLGLAKLYYSRGDYNNAVDTLKNAEDAQPLALLDGKGALSGQAKKLLAICFYKLGDYTQALGIFDKLGKLDDGEYLYYYGETCAKHNLYEQALEILGRIKDKKYLTKAKERIASIQGLAAGYLSNLEPEDRDAIILATEEKYPLAGAVVILADEKMKLLPDNTVTYDSHYIVKILNERGKNDFSEIVLGYDSTYEKVEIEYARTIKPNGEVVAVGEKGIRDVSRYLDFPLYSNSRARIISMPEIAEGAIVEYKIRTTRSQLINKDDFDIAYNLQETEPVISARFAISIPKNRNLRIKPLNLEYNPKNFNLSPIITETKEEKIYRWEFKDIPQIEVEPNMPPLQEINPVILASTFDSWDEIYKWWRSLSRDRITADKAITDKVYQLIQGKKTSEEKIRAIYNYCAQEIRYVGIEYGQAGYQPHPASEIFKNKYGDCKDKAILFVTMLKAAGIEAFAVLIGTRGTPAMEEDFPAVNFNHCIAAVELNNELIFLDITAEVCSFGDLPSDDQKRRVLIFRKDAYEIADTPLAAPEANRVKSKTRLTIASDEAARAQRTVETFGQFDQAHRYWLRYTPPNLIEQGLKEKIQSIVTSGDLITYRYENSDDLNLPIRLTYEFKGKNFLSRAGSARIIPRSANVDTSLVAKAQRGYPLELGNPSLNETYLEITLADDFAVKYLPESLDAKSRWLDYLVSYELKGKTLTVSQRQLVKTRQVPQEEYPDFKKFLEDLAIKLDEHIILEKKNGRKKETTEGSPERKRGKKVQGNRLRF